MMIHTGNCNHSPWDAEAGRLSLRFSSLHSVSLSLKALGHPFCKFLNVLSLYNDLALDINLSQCEIL